MKPQDILALQEAYSQVYESETGRGPRLIDAYDKPPYSDEVKDAPKYKPVRKGPKMKGVIKKEEVDIYNIILSHLLDEGYADTEEAATVIMVNMSEDWRQSIVEVSERGQELAWKTGQAANRALSRTTDPKKRAALHGLQHAAANRSLGGEYPDTPDMRVGGKPVRKVHDVRRGGTGEGDPDSDRGGGHRAARR